MTTTPAISAGRLVVAPTLAAIEAQLEAFGTPWPEREFLALHLYANLFPNADGPSLARVVNAMRDLTDSLIEYDRDEDTARVGAAAVSALVTIRWELQALAPVRRENHAST